MPLANILRIPRVFFSKRRQIVLWVRHYRRPEFLFGFFVQSFDRAIVSVRVFEKRFEFLVVVLWS